MSSSPESHSRLRSLLPFVAKVVISTGLLWVLLSRVDTRTLWSHARHASTTWLASTLLIYLVMILVSAWRWGLLLDAQRVGVSFGGLTSSFLVATFFNNFLPSNIGGDVVRIADTAKPARSKTLATTVVLIDRGLGLLGLVLVAAVGATVSRQSGLSVGPLGPAALWGGFAFATAAAMPAVAMPGKLSALLRPLRVFHTTWVDERLSTLTATLERFKQQPRALIGCFVGAVLVQMILVTFYIAIARSMGVGVTPVQLALVVPMSLLVQLIPVSVNGFGVREAVFGFYFARFGLPLDAALAVSFVGAAMMALFSITGGIALLLRRS
jgi:uncharacterized membrane protein YbhN (UPF0104 family)